jgi:Na+-translocating ferredoxin:NAD+ oxidoreductase RnfG subunit
LEQFEYLAPRRYFDELTELREIVIVIISSYGVDVICGEKQNSGWQGQIQLLTTRPEKLEFLDWRVLKAKRKTELLCDSLEKRRKDWKRPVISYQWAVRLNPLVCEELFGVYSLK